MAHQQASIRILAGAFTFMGLGLAWMAIVGSLPTLQELSAKEPPLQQRPVSAVAGKPLPEPTLDLSIPGVPTIALVPSDQNQPAAAVQAPSVVAPLDSRAAQVAARLRCEAEVEQLCPDSLQGPARRKCLDKRAEELPMPCQQQLRERLVKWKEEHGRITVACQADTKRFCSTVKLGGGQVLQCLQEHSQELSDRCYQTLPKGTVFFKQ